MHDVSVDQDAEERIREALREPVEERRKTLPLKPVPASELRPWGIKPVPPAQRNRRD